jgi:hypothetical protein
MFDRPPHGRKLSCVPGRDKGAQLVEWAMV